MIRSKRCVAAVIECGPMASFRSSAAYKIAINCVAVLAWSILALGATVYWASSADFREQRDREITGELERLSREPDRAELLRELRWRQGRNLPNRLEYALFDKQGKWIAGNAAMAMPAETGLHDVVGRDAAGKRTTIRTGSADTFSGDHVVVGSDATSAVGMNGTILRYFVVAFVILMIVSAVGGVATAHYLRHRLMPISTTANAIVSGDLDVRVPIGSSGDEFDEAGRAFNLMLDRIAGLMENLRQVSSDIAHDLRKPLIRLLNQADRLDQEGAEDRLLQIGDEMLGLFAGILRIAEVEGGGLERSFEEIDLSGLMSEVAESFAPALADAGNSIRWIIEPEITVLGSRELLAQVAANLLDNARIHTPRGTDIVLALGMEGRWARLSVQDNGPGVGEKEREKLLQRFFRAEASRTTPGNGLGLSLVAAATNAHGGSVSVENAHPGLVIVVKIPALRPAPEIDAERSAARPGFLSFLRRG